jgi:adenine phosphoribosyltransferase
MNLSAKIRKIPDWPKKGIMFMDITTLLKDKNGFKLMIDKFLERYRGQKIDQVAGIETRGFIIGPVLSYELGAGYIPIRKKSKLPAKIISEEYDKEYGKDRIEIHADAIKKGEKVLIVDDLIATGGTAIAAANLIKKAGGEVVECAFLIDLPELGGRKRLEAKGFKSFRVMEMFE